MNLTEKKAKLKKLRDTLDKFNAITEPISKEYLKLSSEVHDDEQNEYFKGGITLEKIMALDWNTLREPWYKEVNKFLNTNFSKGMCHCGGMHTDTWQMVVKLSMIRNKPLAEQLDVLHFLPYLKPIETKLGMAKVIDIFESTCGEDGSFDIYIIDDTYKVVKCSYGSPRVLFESKDVMAALDYVRLNHWYTED